MSLRTRRRGVDVDRDGLNETWDRNESELNRIRAMPGLDREMHAKREEELLAAHDAIEFVLGFESPLHERSRRYSGLR